MSSIVLIIALVCFVVLLGLSAFFSSAETALFSLNSLQINKIRATKPVAAKRLEELLATPTRILSTILIGNTIVNVSVSSLGFAILNSFGVPHAEAVAIPCMTVVLLMAGEVVPKRCGMRYACELAPRFLPLLIAFIYFFRPLRSLLERITTLFYKQFIPSSRTLSEDEFLTVVEVGEEEGILNEEERVMVDGIINLEETQASDIMTPRVDITGLDLNDSTEEQQKTIRSCRYHFLPIYRESIDQIEGILDVPRFLLSGQDDIATSITKACFVPENAPLDGLLTEFQRENRRIAIVADEFGGTAGLITRGDILEEVVDDVDNEFGDRKEDIQLVDENKWLIEGSVSIEDVNYELDLVLDAEGADRIAGWVTAQTGRIPKAGEQIEAQGCRVTVERVRRQRIMQVMLEKLEPAEEPPVQEES